MRPERFRSGNRGIDPADAEVIPHASMRPERFRSGNLSYHRNPRSAPVCFNEAGAVPLRKSDPTRQSCRGPGVASMRPERFRSGNRGAAAWWQEPLSCFNEAGAVPLRKSSR